MDKINVKFLQPYGRKHKAGDVAEIAKSELDNMGFVEGQDFETVLEKDLLASRVEARVKSHLDRVDEAVSRAVDVKMADLAKTLDTRASGFPAIIAKRGPDGEFSL